LCRLSELPGHAGSPLNLETEAMPGINTPMLYCGMLNAHFCWHYEDNATYRSLPAPLYILSQIWVGVGANSLVRESTYQDL